MAVDVFDELERRMWNFHRQSLVPLTTISETEDAIIVEIDLPLVRKTDIKIRLIEDGLEIEASLERCLHFERWGTVQRNCEFTSFHRIIPLTRPVVEEGARATFKKGILRVEIPKRKVSEYPIPIN